MKLFLFITAFFMLNFSFCQDCKVKLKLISEHYQGECQNGLAEGQGKASGTDNYTGNFQKGLPEGKGVYTWANGDRYEGEFKKGQMEGEGKFIVQADGKISNGFWKKGEYIGHYQTPYKKIDKSTDIAAFTIAQSKSTANIIRLYIKENQNSIRDPMVNIVVHNGNYQNLITTREYVELVGVTFPFNAKAFIGQQYIEFEIFNQGSWNININIATINGLKN